MSKEKQLKETIESWLNNVDIDDIESFQSVVREIDDVLNIYIENM
ncbi:hypothetical protein [Bacillus thuringiensis]|nr:hypothetical protein [Bacillus thuringiensis]MEB9626260.1 hypothetical protein [Bacillus cereus]